MSDPEPTPPPTQMVALRPLTVTNVGSENLVIKGSTGVDQTVKPGESVDADP